MAELDDLDDDTFGDEDVKNASSETAQTSLELTEAEQAASSSADSQAAEALIKTSIENDVSANIKLLTQIGDANDIPLSDTDTEALTQLNTDCMNIDPTNPTELKTAQQSYNNISLNAKSALDGSIKLSSDKLNSVISPETSQLLEASKQQLSSDLTQLDVEISKPTPDPTTTNGLWQKIKAAFASNSKIIEENEPELAETTKGTLGERAWNIAKMAMSIGAAVGLGYLILSIIASSLTGCYVTSTDANGTTSSTILEGCSSYYSTPGNSYLCRCGVYVPIGSTPVTLSECTTTLKSECNYPYCLGACSSNAPCSGFRDNEPLQCTSGAISASGSVSYGFQTCTPLGIVGNSINASEQAVKQTVNYVSTFLKIMYYLLIAGGIIAVIIFFMYLYKTFVANEVN